ncbi:MAG: sulfatase-like hydrolase/transferase [Chloroflexi bacterium]|nr:sulfatase-like hydrolase/transferase [Chloroflexota bacterium]
MIGPNTSATGATRPNVVLVMADQLRWDAVGAYGNPVVQTPNLDRLAREGVRCERAYTSSPICMPARASVLTGRWPHAHGLWDNGVRLPPDTTTLATVLAHHGYRTGIVGKGHLDVHHLLESPDSYIGGWDTPEAIAAGGKDGWHGPYYGFQQAQLTCGHNRACGHYGTWLHAEHPQAVKLLEREHALELLPGGAWKSALPIELHASTWIGDRSVEFIRRHAAGAPGNPTGGGSGGTGRRSAHEAGGRTPFFLCASFPDPHPPLCTPPPYAGRYDPAAMPAPRRRRGELADKPPHFCDLPDAYEPGWREGAAWRPYGAGHLADQNRTDEADAVRKAIYYAMTELADYNVGRILAALEETGQLDNTVVVVIADHGELLGDHWLDGKGPWHYDGCTRVPLLVRYPPALPAGHVVGEFVSQCDIAPTICDLAGVPYTTWPPQAERYASGQLTGEGILPDVQGISLVPALRAKAPARPHVLMETEWRWNPGLHLKTLRTSDWRLTVYAGRAYGELYDLRADPDEFTNRWDDPACRAARADLIALLLQEVLQTEGRLPPRVVPN